MIQIGKTLRKLREERGLTQDQLAKLIGRTRVAISYIELGNNGPNRTTLDKLNKLFGVDLYVEAWKDSEAS
jgi:transcriptional regulator with XRE-family HTH domain